MSVSSHAENPKGDHDKEQHQEHRASPRGGGSLAAIYHAVMRGGELQAMGRMGIDELGQALRAFPDAIHAHAEPGGMFEPLHRDIAAARDQHAPRESLHSAQQEKGGVHGRPHGKEVQVAEEKKSWVQRILESRLKPGNDQNEQGRGRSLPDEQRDQDNDRGR